jgi:hypothetical protein
MSKGYNIDERDQEKKRIFLLFLKKFKIYGDYVRNIKYGLNIDYIFAYVSLIDLFEWFFDFTYPRYPKNPRIPNSQYWKEWNYHYRSWIYNKSYRDLIETVYY